MHGLIYRLPKLGLFMFIGIAGMFLAPFGMLISKWSALKASVDADNIMMVIFIAYGSATTMFYWTKWMSKLISATNEPRIKDITKKNEMISLTVHAVLMVLLCLLFPVISKVFVEPLMLEMFGVYVSVLPVSVMYMLVILICFIFGAHDRLCLYQAHADQQKTFLYERCERGGQCVLHGFLRRAEETGHVQLVFQELFRAEKTDGSL